MSRTSSILIVLAMIVTAASVTIVLAIQFGFSLGQAMAFGFALFFGMGLAQQTLERRKDRVWMEQRLAEIAAVSGDGQQDITTLANRLARLEQALPGRIRDGNEQIATEVEVVGQLLKQLAEALADLEGRVETRLADVDGRIEAVASRQMRAPGASARIEEPRESPEAAMANPAIFVAPPAAPRVPSAFERDVERLIRQEAIEIHLQPIVTLPQRKVRFYEVLTRLRGEDGLISAADFVPAAESRKAIAKLDTFQVIRAFQILKRLTQRNSDVGLFVNLSTDSLAATGFFREFQSFLNLNRQMAELVMFEFKQSALAEMGPLESESLKAVADMGFRFSVDNVADLRVDFRRYADLGFRMAKVSAERLLGRQPVLTGDIHLEDMAGHLQRQGMTLIVDRVEQEQQVIELLDFNIQYAQGMLFSAPRQVRPEVLSSAQQGSATASPAPRQSAAGLR